MSNVRVFVSGASGNLGTKLIAYLSEQSWCDAVAGVDVRTQGAPQPAHATSKAIFATADLTDPTDRRWRDLLTGSDAVIHFAVKNVSSDCSWEEAAASFVMTVSLLNAAAEAGVRRFVFASSNHVMGGYKDPPLSLGLRPGGLTTVLVPAPGTTTRKAGMTFRPVAYAASKLFGERAAIAKAQTTNGILTSVSVRIGWCQPGRNHPSTIHFSGLPDADPSAAPAGPEDAINLAWFRGMWLSNRDFWMLMSRAILADSAGWPEPGVVVNGMSANTGMAWDLEYGRRLIGFDPQDDSAVELHG